MERIRINVRGVDEAVWGQLKQMRCDEQICLGRLVTEALEAYLEAYTGDPELYEAEAA